MKAVYQIISFQETASEDVVLIVTRIETRCDFKFVLATVVLTIAVLNSGMIRQLDDCDKILHVGLLGTEAEVFLLTNFALWKLSK